MAFNRYWGNKIQSGQTSWQGGTAILSRRFYHTEWEIVVTEMAIQIDINEPEGIKLAVYDDVGDGSKPENLLAETGIIPYPGVVGSRWFYADLDKPVYIAPATWYWIAYFAGGTINNFQHRQVDLFQDYYHTNGDLWPDFPATFPGGGSGGSGVLFAMYAYTQRNTFALPAYFPHLT